MTHLSGAKAPEPSGVTDGIEDRKVGNNIPARA